MAQFPDGRVFFAGGYTPHIKNNEKFENQVSNDKIWMKEIDNSYYEYENKNKRYKYTTCAAFGNKVYVLNKREMKIISFKKDKVLKRGNISEEKISLSLPIPIGKLAIFQGQIFYVDHRALYVFNTESENWQKISNEKSDSDSYILDFSLNLIAKEKENAYCEFIL